RPKLSSCPERAANWQVRCWNRWPNRGQEASNCAKITKFPVKFPAAGKLQEPIAPGIPRRNSHGANAGATARAAAPRGRQGLRQAMISGDGSTPGTIGLVGSRSNIPLASLERHCPMNQSSVVRSDPHILGGTPVFVGTRVPVQALIDYI